MSIYGLFYSIWHVGIENKLLLGPAGCSSGLNLTDNTLSLKEQILSKPVINCEDIAWSMFGLSAATINSLLLLLIFILNAIYLWNIYGEKKKKLLKKNQLKKTSTSSVKVTTDKNILDEIIRVDHAGEYGATRIYDGQIAIFGKESKIGKTIQHMADQEQEHIEKFNELLVEKRVRPTALLPLWNVAGFALGAGTALMGEKAAMACTVAVEKVIGEHYREQQDLLEEDEKELKKTIAKFEKDELEHHDIGLEHDAESAPGYKIMTKVIEIGCKTAIAISKKI